MGIFQQFPYSNFHEMNLDQIIKIMREMQDEWEDTKTEWASYKDFIDNYFENLDVSDEVLAAMQIFVGDGTLNTIIDPVIATEVAQWLVDNITPTTPIVDASLSISGAAADAKVVGDIFDYMDDYLEIPVNLNDVENIALYKGYVDSSGVHYDDGFRLLYVPCEAEHIYTIRRLHTDSNMFRIASTNNTSIANNTPVSDYVNADSDASVEYTTYSGDKYIIIGFYRASDTYTIEQLATTISIIDKTYGDQVYRQDKADALYSNVIRNGLYSDYEKIAKNYFLYNGVWSQSGSVDAKHICFPVEENDEIFIVCGSYPSNICFMANNYALYGMTPTLVGTATTVYANSCETFTVPAGAHYVYILAYMNGAIRLPDIFEINGEDIIKKPVAPNEIWETIFFDDFERDELGDQWKRVEIDPTFQNSYISLFKDIDDLAYIDSSCLVLKSRLKRPDETFNLGNDKYGNARTMVSGYVSTQDSFALTHGKVSARIKTSDEFGTAHPWAFFTFSQNNFWPKAVELDFAENAYEVLTSSITVNGRTYPAGSYSELLWTNTHYDNNNNENHEPYYYMIGYAELTAPDTWDPMDVVYNRGNFDTRDWHIYECEFNEYSVIYKIDGLYVNSINYNDLTNTSDWDNPKDIRFNIKTCYPGNTENSMLYVDWVKVESKVKTPMVKLYHSDISMNIGDRYYVNPTFTPTDATNLAFIMESDDPTIVSCYNYLRGSDAIYHRLEANAAGIANITITSANGDISYTFKVNVS